MHIRNRFADDFHSDVPEITTCEREIGLLLIEVSSKLFIHKTMATRVRSLVAFLVVKVGKNTLYSLDRAVPHVNVS